MKRMKTISILTVLLLSVVHVVAQQTGKIRIKLNKDVYNNGDNINATVTFGVIAPMYKQYLVWVSPETGDIETLQLKNLSSKKLAGYSTLKILIGLRPVKNDNKLMVKPGGKVLVYYYKRDLNGAHPNTIIAKNKADVITVSAAVSSQ